AATIPVIVLATVFRAEMMILGAALVVAWVVVVVNARQRPAARTHDAMDLRSQPFAGRWGFLLLVLASTVALGAVLDISLAARPSSLADGSSSQSHPLPPGAHRSGARWHCEPSARDVRGVHQQPAPRTAHGCCVEHGRGRRCAPPARGAAGPLRTRPSGDGGD